MIKYTKNYGKTIACLHHARLTKDDASISSDPSNNFRIVTGIPNERDQFCR